jgi:hypothetical protein
VELGILHACKNILGTALNAIQAAFALIDIVQVAQLIAERIGFVSIKAINATPLDAVVATRAILAPINYPQLAHWTDTGCNRSSMDRVLCRHG